MCRQLSFVLPVPMVAVEPIVEYQISTGQDSEGACNRQGEISDKAHPSLQASLATPKNQILFHFRPLCR